MRAGDEAAAWVEVRSKTLVTDLGGDEYRGTRRRPFFPAG